MARKLRRLEKLQLGTSKHSICEAPKRNKVGNMVRWFFWGGNLGKQVGEAGTKQPSSPFLPWPPLAVLAAGDGGHLAWHGISTWKTSN